MNRKKPLSSSAKWGMLFVLPWVVIFCLFSVIPLFLALKYSFMNINLLQPYQSTFAGFSNWFATLIDIAFWHSMFNVVYNQIIFIILSSILALVFASLLNEIKAFSSIFRTVYFLPVITSAMVTILIFGSVTGPQGPIQMFLVQHHLMTAPINWQMTKWLPMPMIALYSSWKWFGIQMIIYLAGIAAIDQSIYEAAGLDGAGWWKKFWYITLPALKPQIAFNLTMNIINGLQMFTEVYGIFNITGGPYGSGTTPMTYIYNQAFYNMQMGKACSTGIILAMIMFAATTINLKFMTRKEK